MQGLCLAGTMENPEHMCDTDMASWNVPTLSSLVPSPTLGRWVWLPVYSKLGQHYVSGPRSGPTIG